MPTYVSSWRGVRNVLRLLIVLGLGTAAYGETAEPERGAPASIEATGGHSVRAQISADGRSVAFDSYATNLLPVSARGVVNNVFVHDRQSGSTKAVSLAADGTPGNGHSLAAALSADGRFIAFHSEASNLVAGDTNRLADIFVREISTGATTRVSVAPGGTEALGGPSMLPALSADGRFVAFESQARNLVPDDTNAARDIFVHDRQTGTTTRMSVGPDGVQADANSYNASISADGLYVAFESAATNLVPGDGKGFPGIFVHDRQTGTTTRVSVGPGGVPATGGASTRPRISANGRFVVFESEATNLVPNDTNGFADIFVHDRQTGTTTRVSIATGGTQAVGGHSFFPSISADGRFVAFQSDATNLVRGDTNERRDIFVHDRKTGTTTRVSVGSGGAQAIGGGAARPQISADGRYVAFESAATNLVPDDTNEVTDIFVHDRVTLQTTRINVIPTENAPK